MGGSAAPLEAVQPGTPVSLTIPPGALGITVTRPDGSVVELVPGTGLAASVTFAGTEQTGVYTVTPQAPPAATGAVGPSVQPTLVPTARPDTGASAGASLAASPAPAIDPICAGLVRGRAVRCR